MNWPGGTCFAPESLLDDSGRRIFWAWVMDRRERETAQASGWSGVMTLPRVLSLDEGGAVRIEPAEELETLRMNHRVDEDIHVGVDEVLALNDVSGDRMELDVEFQNEDADEFGVIVRRSPESEEQTALTYDVAAGLLRIDLSHSALDKSITYQQFCIPPEGGNPQVHAQEAPLTLQPGEPLRLRIFLDRSIIEVFANGRQCMTQRVYPSRADSTGVALISRGGSVNVAKLDAWDMARTNPG